MILDRAQVAGGAADAPRKRIYLSPPVLAGFALVLLALVGIGLVSRRSITTLVETYDWVADTHDVLATLAALETEVVSGEAGKRAYLTTGLERHLARYEAGGSAAAESLARLRSLTADNPGQRQRLDRLQAAVRSRMANLQESIALHRRDPGAAAAQVALTDQGERLEGDLGATIAEMSGEERRLLARREGDARASARRALMVLLLGTAAAVAFLGLSAVVIDRQLRARQRAEDAVRASEATYRAVARNFPSGGLILFDHDLRFQMADGTGRAAPGHRPEGLVGGL